MIICDYIDSNVKNYLKNKEKETILTFFKEQFSKHETHNVIFIDDLLDNDDYQKINMSVKNILDILDGSLKVYGYDLFKYLKISIKGELGKLYKYKYAVDKISRIRGIYSFVCSTDESRLIELLKFDYEIISLASYDNKISLIMKIRKKIFYSKIYYLVESFVISCFYKDNRKNVHNILSLVDERTMSSQLHKELRKDFKIFIFGNRLSFKKSFIKRMIKFNVLKLKNHKRFIKINLFIEHQYEKVINKVAVKIGIRQEQAKILLTPISAKLRNLSLCLSILEDNSQNINLLISMSSIFNTMGLAVDFFKKHKLHSIELIHGLPLGFVYNKSVSKIAVYGQRDKLFYAKHGVNSQKVVTTGCPRYDKFFYIRKEQRKYNYLLLILDWVSFSSSQNTTRIIFQQVMCMLELLKKINDVKLIIKLHPRQHGNEIKYIKSLVFKGDKYKKYVKIVKNNDITDLLKKASIVFTHSSSVGLEALLMKKPVIILDVSPGFKPVYKGYSGFLIAKDFDQLIMLTKKVLKDIDEYLRLNSKNIEKTIKFFYADLKGESYKRVADLAKDCISK